MNLSTSATLLTKAITIDFVIGIGLESSGRHRFSTCMQIRKKPGWKVGRYRASDSLLVLYSVHA